MRVRESALKGYRTLAVAQGAETGTPTLLGLVTLYDPPRLDARQLIAELRALGVAVKMLTGDALAVASEIARGVGLPAIRRVADLKAASAEAGNAAVDVLAGADGFAENLSGGQVNCRAAPAGRGARNRDDGRRRQRCARTSSGRSGYCRQQRDRRGQGGRERRADRAGSTNIVALVEQGRTIYQRILTWIILKISRTILKAAFVAIAFVLTGKFVVSAFAMLLLVFMTDFANFALTTDHVRPSRQPETWNIGGLVLVSVALGVLMTAESLVLLWAGWSRFGLATNDSALYTFSFLTLLYFAVFSIVSARERRWFWATLPSRTFLAALGAETLVGTVLTFVGLPGLMPLPWWQVLTIFASAVVCCLVVNDAVKDAE